MRTVSRSDFENLEYLRTHKTEDVLLTDAVMLVARILFERLNPPLNNFAYRFACTCKDPETSVIAGVTQKDGSFTLCKCGGVMENGDGE